MISVRHLTKRFGAHTAVDDVTFDVQPGVVTGFLGPNGSGKSTTLRLILGLQTADAGQALVNGRPYTDAVAPLREVGALLEARAFHPGRSARTHLEALAAGNRIPRQRVDAVLATVGLTDVAGRRTGGYSLGMAQRLGIATALLGDPGIVVLDEPANGLDPDGICWLRCLLNELAAEGRTVLMSSHLIAEVAATAERLLVIGHGRLLADTTVADLTTRYGSLEEAYFGLTAATTSFAGRSGVPA